MARPGEQTWLFGRLRVDRPGERAMDALSARRHRAGQRKSADALDRAAGKIKDPKKRAKAEKDAKAYRRKHC